jgi:hypothetical protein
MRAVTGLGIEDPAITNVANLLGPAENFGGRTSFKKLVPFAAVAAVIFAILWVSDRSRGGYRAQRINPDEAVLPQADRGVAVH